MIRAGLLLGWLFILLCVIWAIGDEHWDDDGTDLTSR